MRRCRTGNCPWEGATFPSPPPKPCGSGWSTRNELLNLSRQTPECSGERFWATCPGAVPAQRPTLQATLTWQPQSLDWSWCCSLQACNILRARLPGTTAYVTCQRAAPPVFGDRQRLQLDGLRRPYCEECISLFVPCTRCFMLPLAAGGIGLVGPTFLSPPANRSGLAGALETSLVSSGNAVAPRARQRGSRRPQGPLPH